jgi:hypothetical protein
MQGHFEGRRELAVKMKLLKGRDRAHRVQVQIAVEMPIDVIERPPHPGLIVLRPRLRLLRGDAT